MNGLVPLAGHPFGCNIVELVDFRVLAGAWQAGSDSKCLDLQCQAAMEIVEFSQDGKWLLISNKRERGSRHSTQSSQVLFTSHCGAIDHILASMTEDRKGREACSITM